MIFENIAVVALVFDCIALVAVVAAGIFSYNLLKNNRKIKARVDILQDSIDALGQGLIFFDEDERFVVANLQAYRYFPFLNKNRYISGNLSAFLDYMFDHAVDCDESLKNTLDKSVQRFTSEGFREVIEWAENKFCLVEAQKTHCGRTVLILKDVSDIKKQEEDVIRLNNCNFELTEAVEAATNGIVITNPYLPGHPVLFVNKAFCEHADISRREIVGRGIQSLIYDLVDEESKNAIYDALDSGQSTDLEIQIKRHDHLRWFSFRLTPVKDQNGDPGLFICILTETTELKLREAEFFQGQKLEALGQLAAGVAHDFNNILSIIDGYSRIAAGALEDDEVINEYLQKITAATGRGASLTRQMLTFSRHKISSDDVIDLAQAVQDQVVLLKPLIDASIDLSIQAEAENMFVECALDNITQILMNLTINARDAMSDGGNLIVSVCSCQSDKLPKFIEERDKDFACLSVTDTGVGMDKDIQKKVFDPFFTTKDQGKGTGLGLSMVYGLVKQMEGYIDVVSAPGQGAAVSIYLPLSEKGPNKQIVGSPQNLEKLSLQGYTAVVAEDEPDLLDLVSNMLEKLGMNVITALNGNEALVRQDDYEGHIDLLLTDVVMPELDGIQLAEMFQSLRPETQVIYMSGYPAGGQQSRIDLPKGAHFVAKPLQYDSLAQLIFECLNGENKSSAHGQAETAAPRWYSSETIDVSDKARE